jgi:hypothetical protein
MTPRSRFLCISMSFLLFLVFSPDVRSQNPGDAVFSGTQVYNIRFQFQQQNFWDSLMYYHDLG